MPPNLSKKAGPRVRLFAFLHRGLRSRVYAGDMNEQWKRRVSGIVRGWGMAAAVAGWIWCGGARAAERAAEPPARPGDAQPGNEPWGPPGGPDFDGPPPMMVPGDAPWGPGGGPGFGGPGGGGPGFGPPMGGCRKSENWSGSSTRTGTSDWMPGSARRHGRFWPGRERAGGDGGCRGGDRVSPGARAGWSRPGPDQRLVRPR